VCVRTLHLDQKNVIPSSVMRTRFLQRPNRSEGPCVKACRIEELRKHKVPPAYSRAEESARSLNGRRDDDSHQPPPAYSLTQTIYLLPTGVRASSCHLAEQLLVQLLQLRRQLRVIHSHSQILSLVQNVHDKLVQDLALG